MTLIDADIDPFAKYWFRQAGITYYGQQEQRTEGDLAMSNNMRIKYTLEELNKLALQRDSALSRIENMKKQYGDNKLIIYILETIEKDLQ